MSAVAVIAFGAVSALGEGVEAAGVVPLGAATADVLGLDDELARAGLERPFCARVARPDEAGFATPRGRDRATRILARSFTLCAADLDRVLPAWRSLRVGLALGTSSGGMRTFEETFATETRAPAPGWFEGTYLGPLAVATRPTSFVESALVMGACASSTLALGVARSWLLEDRCDVVLAGGFDAVSVFVASGFEVLRATSASGHPRPFRRERDGLTLGEGGVLLALVRAGDPALRSPSGVAHEAPRALGFVAGFGASCDAVHLTAPDRTGAGLARAIVAAQAEAGDRSVDLVSAHATATVFNDAAEANALRLTLGDRPVDLHALKGATGHTLGAAGGLETLSALLAMREGLALPSAGEGPTEAGFRLASVAEPRDARVTLKLSAAFGGTNAALVLTKDDPAAPLSRLRPVYLGGVVTLTGNTAASIDPGPLAELTGYPLDRVVRADHLVRLTLSAVAKLDARLVAEGGRGVRGAGIIVGHGLATIDTNAAYHARILSAGARRAEPRRFPYTTPNACAGECAVAFGLTGPAFAVGGGPHGGIEALAVAASLVRTGVSERIVVVGIDAGGEGSRRVAPSTRAGAVAFIVDAEPVGGLVAHASVRLERAPCAGADGQPTRMPAAPAAPEAIMAHAALLPLAGPSDGASELECRTPWGFIASARVVWSLPGA